MNYKILTLILCFFILTLSSEASYADAYKDTGALHEWYTTAKSDTLYYVNDMTLKGYILGVIETWHFIANSQVMNALRAAFPCQ